MFVDIHKDPIVISFKKFTMRINISPEERPQLMKVILQGKSDHHGTKFKTVYNLRKQDNVHVRMLPKWFYREIAEKFAEQETWDFTIVTMNLLSPDRNILVLQFLAYKTKASIPQCTKDC